MTMRRTSAGEHGRSDDSVDDVLGTTSGASDVVDLLREVHSEPVGSVTGGGTDVAVAVQSGRQRAPEKRRRATALRETMSPVYASFFSR